MSALDFLKACRQSDGGIATYPSCDAVRAAIHIPLNMLVDGWASSHVCVTATVGGITGFRGDCRLRAFLRRQQLRSGKWNGYWWCDAEYATALALEALAHSADLTDRRAIEQGVRYLRTCDSGDSAFSRALRIVGLCSVGCELPRKLVGELVELQQADGSWPPSARLRIPPPDEIDPELRWDWDESHKGFGSIQLDVNRIFTTSTAIWALSLADGRR